MNLSRLQNLDQDLFHVLLWKKFHSLLSETETAALNQFGQRFGSQALESRILSLLKDKTHGKLEQLIIEAVTQAKVAAQDIRSATFLLPEPETNQLSTPHVSSPKSTDQIFKKPITRFSQPLLQSLVTLKFWTEIIERHFSDHEKSHWIKKLSRKNSAAVKELTQEIETRVGKSISQIVTEIKTQVVEDYSLDVANTVEEVRKLNRQKLTRQLHQALLKTDVVRAQEIFGQVLSK